MDADGLLAPAEPAAAVAAMAAITEPGAAVTIASASGGALPFGKSIVPRISAADPMSAAGQYCIAALVVVFLLILPFQPSLLAGVAGVDGAWDGRHNMSDPPASPYHIVGTLRLLMGETMGVGAAQGNTAALLTGAFFGLLFALDILSEFMPDTIRWPPSWNTNNRQCYTEMFCESDANPSRRTLVKRPGNTYSNFIYLYGSIVILISVAQIGFTNRFVVPDAIFGVMMLILALLSVTWHASNAPKSQYIDLWSMDSCIAYLILRIACLGELAFLKWAFSMSTNAATSAAWVTCTVLYVLVILGNAKKQWSDHKHEFLDAGCPFAGRTMLLAGRDIVTGDLSETDAVATADELAASNRAIGGGKGVTIVVVSAQIQRR